MRTYAASAACRCLCGPRGNATRVDDGFHLGKKRAQQRPAGVSVWEKAMQTGDIRRDKDKEPNVKKEHHAMD